MTKTYIRSILLSSIAWGIVLPTVAFAQQQPENKTATYVNDKRGSQDTGSTDAAEPDIVVTGSRIVRDGYSAPTPVTVATTQDLIKTTPTNLPDALNKLPQFQNSFGPGRSNLNFANSPTHGNILNLRSIGPGRTLILFDGIRVAPTTYTGTVDSNIIPNLLVQRVDIVTGGASAAYGSDAISGVVNFVLNRKYEGITGTASAGISQRGDNANQRIGLAAGIPFAGGRGHVLMSGEYFNSEGMLRGDRATGRRTYGIVGSNPGCVNPNPAANPTACSPGGTLNPFITVPDVRITISSDYGMITGGSVPGNPFNRYVFNPDGTYRPFQSGAVTGTPGFQILGDGFTIPTKNTASAPLSTYQGFGRLSYEVGDDIEVFAQGLFSRADLSYSVLANSLAPPTTPPIFRDNPFLPAAIAATLPTANDFVSIASFNGNNQSPQTRERTDYWTVTGGAEGKAFGNWNWNVAYTHASSIFTVAQSGLYDYQKTYAAVDVVRDPATGQPTCRVLLNPDSAIRNRFAGCSPLNILGDPVALTPAGYAYATGTSRYRAETKQDSVVAALSGSLFELPSGSVDLAVGGEYRRQSLRLTSNADPALLSTPAQRADYFAGLRGVPSVALNYYLTNVGVADGSYNIKEAFAEIGVPILKDTPFFQELSLNAAGRITDYSTSGTVKTWKIGATWKPVQDLLFRGALSRDIRAPNLFELFAGSQSSLIIALDPVTGINTNVNSLSGGNRGLKPEIGKTLTAGVVFSPSFIPGLTISADYYRIRVSGQISSLGAQQTLTNCFNGGPSAPECALIERPTPTSFPTLIRLVPANLAFLKTDGIDFDASYRRTVGEGAIGVRLYMSYLHKYETQQYAGAPVLQFAGITNGTNTYPHWRGQMNVDYSVGNFGVTVTEQFIGKMQRGLPGQLSNFVDPNVPAVVYTDLSLRWTVPSNRGSFEFFSTINNLFDKQPPIIAGPTPAVTLPTAITAYDVVGRAFTAGVKVKF